MSVIKEAWYPGNRKVVEVMVSGAMPAPMRYSSRNWKVGEASWTNITSLCLTRLSLGFSGQDIQSLLLMGKTVAGRTICSEFGPRGPESSVLLCINWEQQCLLSSFSFCRWGLSLKTVWAAFWKFSSPRNLRTSVASSPMRGKNPVSHELSWALSREENQGGVG